jgi:hypothetical protein
MRYLLFPAAVVLFLVAWVWPRTPAAADSSATPTPVLVELFTSEGCSSCPPADSFLQKLDAQPVPGAQLIVLSEHVDYWNHIGWKDPFSSRSFSDRQDAYAKRFGLDGVYTPEMVVDGSSEFVGSNSARAEKALSQALRATKVSVRLSAPALDTANKIHTHVETDALPAVAKEAEVYLAVALDHAETEVARGENAGRKLSHTAVLRQLVKLGAVQPGHAFAGDVQVKLEPGTVSGRLRVIAFVQEPGQGRVIGAALQNLPAK